VEVRENLRKHKAKDLGKLVKTAKDRNGQHFAQDTDRDGGNNARNSLSRYGQRWWK
jgi:hypothetical protein